MKRATGQLRRSTYDLVVVGGGMFGSCTAWEAASRGLSVAIIERSDFGSGTSGNHFRVAHGGIRYLQHLDLSRVRESARERSALIRVAPHLVYPLPIVMPTYGHGLRGKSVLRAGFAAYDLLTADRNRGIDDPDRRIPRSRFLDRGQAVGLFPGLDREGLTGAGVFYDGQIFDSSRLVLAFVRSAAERGADVANYLEVERFVREGRSVTGVAVRDRLTGDRMEVSGRIIVNATGPWAADLLRHGMGLDLGPRTPTFSRDVGLVTSKHISGNYGLACPLGSGDADAVLDRRGRHLFVVPWREQTLVGVWHGVDRRSPSEVAVTPDELQDYIAEANEAFQALNLSIDDVILVNTGLVLFGDREQDGDAHSFGKRSLLIDHEVEDRIAGLVTLIGVRATMGRRMAEQTVELVAKKLARELPVSPTTKLPLTGGRFDSFEDLIAEIARHPAVGGRAEVAQNLAHYHGSAFEAVLAYTEADERLARPIGTTPVVAAEVAHAVEQEAARTLLDVVHRRTALGAAETPSDEVLARCANLMAEQLGWSAEKRKAQVDEARSFYDRRAGLSDDPDRMGSRSTAHTAAGDR